MRLYFHSLCHTIPLTIGVLSVMSDHREPIKTNMKNTQITISNNGSEVKFSLETTNGKSIAKVQKALVYRFMDYYDTLRSVGAKSFKATEPFNIALDVNGVMLWDTKMSMQAQAKLKLINTPKGRASFEARLERIIAFAVRTQNLDTDGIISDFESRLLEVIA